VAGRALRIVGNHRRPRLWAGLRHRRLRCAALDGSNSSSPASSASPASPGSLPSRLRITPFGGHRVAILRGIPAGRGRGDARALIASGIGAHRGALNSPQPLDSIALGRAMPAAAPASAPAACSPPRTSPCRPQRADRLAEPRRRRVATRRPGSIPIRACSPPPRPSAPSGPAPTR
jgi:hypothetical protein